MSLAELSVTEVSELLLGGTDEETWEDAAEVYAGDGESVEGLGLVKVVENFGGEGQGDQYYLVFKVTEGDVNRYFRIDGYYSSYSGGEYDGDLREVTPVQRLVVFYE